MALNNDFGNKRAYAINTRGGYRNLSLDFEFGNDAEVSSSCSLQWKNQVYVFGGYNHERQVSMVNGLRLERKGTLDFTFDSGGCTVLNEQTIILCFEFKENKVCRQSNSPLGVYTKLPNSNLHHWVTRVASFDGK